MKRILVTGGAGFIGSHLCVRLLNEGCQVVCLDNFLTGSPKNIQHLTANPNFQMAEQDITTLISILIYQNAFKTYDMGLASAMAWLLFFIVAVLTAVSFISQKHWVYYGDEER